VALSEWKHDIGLGMEPTTTPRTQSGDPRYSTVSVISTALYQARRAFVESRDPSAAASPCAGFCSG